MKKNINKKTTAACPAVVAYRIGALDKATAVETRNISNAIGLGTDDVAGAISKGYLKKHSTGGGGPVVVANNLGSNTSEILPLRREGKRIAELLSENRKVLIELSGKLPAFSDITADSIRNATQAGITGILRERVCPNRNVIPADALKCLHLLDERYPANKYYVTEKFAGSAVGIILEVEAYLAVAEPVLAWKIKYMPTVLGTIRSGNLGTSAKVLETFNRAIDEKLRTTSKNHDQLGADLLVSTIEKVQNIKASGKTSFTDVDVSEIMEKV